MELKGGGNGTSMRGKQRSKSDPKTSLTVQSWTASFVFYQCTGTYWTSHRPPREKLFGSRLGLMLPSRTVVESVTSLSTTTSYILHSSIVRTQISPPVTTHRVLMSLLPVYRHWQQAAGQNEKEAMITTAGASAGDSFSDGVAASSGTPADQTILLPTRKSRGAGASVV